MTSMSSIDQQFVEYIVKSLVSNPDAVVVERRIDEKGVLLELTVDPEDLGRVIGKRGATAQSLRTLLRALGTKNDARYNLKVIDNGVGGSHSDENGGSQRSNANADDSRAVLAVPAPVNTGSDNDDDDDEAVATDNNSDSARMSKTRQELQELDDLDV
jgi:predicted RNA-binding protein YlqC (UPF0109 family)